MRLLGDRHSLHDKGLCQGALEQCSSAPALAQGIAISHEGRTHTLCCFCEATLALDHVNRSMATTTARHVKH